MMSWVSAKYGANKLQNTIFLSSLEEVGIVGRYNIFHMHNGGIDIVVFRDQTKLLNLIRENKGAIFALKFLKSDLKYHKYVMPSPTGDVEMLTLAAATIVMHGKEDFNRSIKITENGFIMIE